MFMFETILLMRFSWLKQWREHILKVNRANSP